MASGEPEPERAPSCWTGRYMAVPLSELTATTSVWLPHGLATRPPRRRTRAPVTFGLQRDALGRAESGRLGPLPLCRLGRHRTAHHDRAHRHCCRDALDHLVASFDLRGVLAPNGLGGCATCWTGSSATAISIY